MDVTGVSSVLAGLADLLDAYPLVGFIYTTVVRWLFPVLAIVILVKAIRSLLSVEIPAEVWAYIRLPNDSYVPLSHWENVIGRARSSDIIVNFPSVSRNHCTLNRSDDGSWTITDIGSKEGTMVNSVTVEGVAPVELGDTITVGGVNLRLMPVTADEKRANVRFRFRAGRPVRPWTSLVFLTIFQSLTIIQLLVALGAACPPAVPLAFLGLMALMWAYCLVLRSLGQVGFEMETIAFFLSTLSLAITASSVPEAVLKQLIAVVLGIVIFLILGWYLRDLQRAKKLRTPLMIIAVALFAFNLIFGSTLYGAKNWIIIGSFSFQPSEIIKIAFIYAGAATMAELFEKKNLYIFMIFSAVCIGCLALMSDFGTAAIFFVTFLVIAFLRSGDFSKLFLITGAAAFGVLILLRFKPYIANRFAAWGHVWEYASTSGFQQTRTMSAGASGGLLGLGGGEGWLKNVAAADTDLVFGMLCEEWGLIIAILAVLSIVTLAVFAVRAITTGRSGFYTIAACAATSLLLFQTILNVFGAVDILPLTGVTFPFVSNGGTSMMVSWGLLAFLKAADNRQNASFAIRKPKRRFMRGVDHEET